MSIKQIRNRYIKPRRKTDRIFSEAFQVRKKNDTLEHLYRVYIIIIILYRSSARVILLEQDLYDTITNKKNPDRIRRAIALKKKKKVRKTDQQ